MFLYLLGELVASPHHHHDHGDCEYDPNCFNFRHRSLLKSLLCDLNRFDVVAPLAAVGLQLRIGANARDGLDELHGLPAAKARDWMPWLVSMLFGCSHGRKLRLKSRTFSITDVPLMPKPSPKGTTSQFQTRPVERRARPPAVAAKRMPPPRDQVARASAPRAAPPPPLPQANPEPEPEHLAPYQETPH